MKPTDPTLIAAERADLRKALCVAMHEIQYLADALAGQRRALKRHDDNWRAMKGVEPRRSPPIAGLAMSEKRRRGLAYVFQVYGISRRAGGQLLPKGRR